MLVCDEWILTPERVAVHQPTATAVLADLHIGYHSARRRRGDAVPVPLLSNLLAPLADVLTRYSLHRTVVAGDLFEDGPDDAIMPALIDWLTRQAIALFAVVPGNHDRGLVNGVSGIEIYPDGFTLGSWLVVHGDTPLPRGQTVCGHWHPALRAGLRLQACFLLGKRVLVLPAYCREARGVAVNGSRKWQHLQCLVPVGADVLDFGSVGVVSAQLQRTSPRR